MKIFLYIISLVCITLHASEISAKGYRNQPSMYPGDVDFAEPNSLGDTIYYFYEDYNGSEGSINIFVGEMANTTMPFKTDSLVIPAKVMHDAKEHIVVGMVPNAFFNIPSHVTSLTLPPTFMTFGESTTIGVAYSSFKNIYVGEQNPYYTSKDGVLYDKNCKTLVAYPPMRADSLVTIEEGIEALGKNAFCCSNMRKSIILPNTLKTIEDRAFFNLPFLEELVLKDSIEHIGNSAFSRSLHRLIIGKGVKDIGYSFVNRGTNNTGPDSIQVICYTIEPPKVIFSESAKDKTKFINSECIHLYVPRNALNSYLQADVWKNCAHILPIEPPIITGLSSAEVSWVQNFSATGYIWTLYTDEAKTQRLMSLTFDTNGHLVNIDINSSHMPSRMPALSNEDDENGTEKRFAEYYTFTITGLSAETKYYYTRQSLNGTEVIDEESGSFTTQQAAALSGALQQNGERRTKFLRDGQMYILREGKTYSVTGQEVK